MESPTVLSTAPRVCPFCQNDPSPNCYWCDGTRILSEAEERAKFLVHPKFGPNRPPIVLTKANLAMMERLRRGEIVELASREPIAEREDHERLVQLELTERELLDLLSCLRAHTGGGQIPEQGRRAYLEQLLDDQWEDQYPFSCG